MTRPGCALLTFGLVVYSAGCGGSGPTRPEPGSDAKSPVEFVEQRFNAAPVGAAAAKYKPGSAKDGSGGKVQFEDLAGVKYEVTVTAEGKSFKTSDPKPIQ